MILETSRLRLRPFRETDYSDILAYGTDPNFYQYLPVEEQTEETLRLFFDERMADQEQQSKSRVTFAVALTTDDKILGTIRLGVFDEEKRFADIGYAMNLARQGNGYMTEAVQRVLQYSFLELGLLQIWATVDKDNSRSWKLMERLGMTRVGNLPVGLEFPSGSERDFVYCISSYDFIEPKAGDQ
ncbi:GNAT family N-acetyltransferase [Sneathiella marina]|uniref:GNAT family N-acetyltransferase n=1 Tax=Sneathiella marina TaxID=2950108 RepID=A0ABY4W0J0_9PROT|nr:GNAT family N-acetyltransferase [Sneathiella marina]USG60474.1 GNAT family N-acetyltransferase [Sneathiella marina]